MVRIISLLGLIMAFHLGHMPEASCGKKAETGTIYLVPVGKVEEEVLLYLSSQLEKIFPFPVKVGEALPHPNYAYNKTRGQYKSDLILEKLQELDLERAKRIVGAVDLDLYTSGLNFVFGQALIRGKTCLTALPRLRQEFYGLAENKKLYYQRAVKEAVHELGHTFGLAHCKKPECVMHFSNSLYDTDRKGRDFCRDCRRKLPF